MQQSPQITFRHMAASPAVEVRIREEVSALEHCFNRITSCRIVVEAPHQHHQRGKGFHISINLHVPGSEIVVNHEPSLHSTAASSETGEWEKHLETQPDHKDIYVAVRDAFVAAHRRLEDHARVRRGDTKHHAEEAETL